MGNRHSYGMIGAAYDLTLRTDDEPSMTKVAIQPPAPRDIDEAALQAQLQTLVGVCARLGQVKPVEEVLDELLAETRRLVPAEAGTVYLIEGGSLRFVCCQNDARPDLCVAPQVQTGASAMAPASLKGARVPLDERSLSGFSAKRALPLRIDDAYALGEGGTYRFDPSYDRATGYRTRSVLVIPLLVEGAPPIGVLQVINRRRDDGTVTVFSPSDEQLAMAVASMASILVRNTQLQAQVQRLHLDMIFRLAQAAEFRDNETGAHIQRVSMYGETVARTMGMPSQWCQNLLFAAPMHDVGKLGVPDAILKKEGPLTDGERDLMKTHTVIGGQILGGSDNELLRMAEQVALTHHERWDGKGYPRGIRGEEIPLAGRITAVTDVFDALTSARCYKPAFSLEKSLKIIAEGRGSHFDPAVVDAFLRSRDTIESIYHAYRDTLAGAE